MFFLATGPAGFQRQAEVWPQPAVPMHKERWESQAGREHAYTPSPGFPSHQSLSHKPGAPQYPLSPNLCWALRPKSILAIRTHLNSHLLMLPCAGCCSLSSTELTYRFTHMLCYLHKTSACAKKKNSFQQNNPHKPPPKPSPHH